MGNTKPIIAVVDDSPSFRALFERSTEELGIELLTFGSAEESWAYLQDNRPDILFLNIIMPDKDGLTFLRELRKLPLHTDTPVVMISSKDYAQDRNIATELGALEFITKPMPMQAITDVVVKYSKAETKS
ncbi:MAG: response regulator [Thiotrichales bacterium]|nr:response regulator [Thiotrichales bacterium]